MEEAAAFLKDPKVSPSTPDKKIAFLRKKGLGLFDIEIVAERVGDKAVVAFLTDHHKVLGKQYPPVHPDKVFTLAELSELKGLNGKDLCISCKGVVYRVDPGFYGEGMSYFAFAGADSSRHLAKVVIGTTELNQTWTSLDAKQMKVLDDWEEKYQAKYTILGRIDLSELSPPVEKAEEDDAKAEGGKPGCAAQ